MRDHIIGLSLLVLLLVGTANNVRAQAAPPPVLVEAESGTVGSEFETLTQFGVTFLSITTDFNETSGSGDYPGAERTAVYTVTLPDTGSYAVYVRLQVGAETFNDDSFFYAFGEPDPTDGEAWTLTNGLANVGYNDGTIYVDSEGGAAEGVWKWLRLTGYENTSEAGDTLRVGPGELEQVFSIGARENGLLIDKFAFAPLNAFYTVSNLDNAEPGVFERPEDFVPTGPPLAQGQSKWLGTGWDPLQTENMEFYWNQITPGNGGKWGWIEGTRDQMNWTDADTAYAIAKRNNWPIRFHVLVWGSQQPTWVPELEPEEQLEELREWMEAVAARYPDLDFVEVVNEPLHQPPDDRTAETGDYVDALGGSGETGWDWIINAFTMAREVFPPETRLMINDYGILSSTSEARRYREIVELLQARDLIDGIGVQGHAFSTRFGTPLTAVLDILAETGLPIQVTEMDVDGNPNRSPFITPAQSDQNQLKDMQRIFPPLWEHPAVEGITMWGWRPPVWRQDADAFLVRDDGRERPALEWLREYISSTNVSTDESPETLVPGQLAPAYPNPFTRQTVIPFAVQSAGHVTLTVFDALGREVATLVDGVQPAGPHTAVFDGSALPSGLYVYRLEAPTGVDTGQMILTR